MFLNLLWFAPNGEQFGFSRVIGIWPKNSVRRRRRFNHDNIRDSTAQPIRLHLGVSHSIDAVSRWVTTKSRLRGFGVFLLLLFDSLSHDSPLSLSLGYFLSQLSLPGIRSSLIALSLALFHFYIYRVLLSFAEACWVVKLGKVRRLCSVVVF